MARGMTCWKCGHENTRELKGSFYFVGSNPPQERFLCRPCYKTLVVMGRIDAFVQARWEFHPTNERGI